MSKIVIIGCGVIGAAIAYELSLIPGLDITVVEKHSAASGSTGAALGVLMGIISHKKKGRAWRFRRISLQRYQTLIPELSAQTGQKISVNHQGIFKLLFTADNLTKWQKLQDFRQQEGWQLELGDRSFVAEQCPQIEHPELMGAVYSPQDGQIHPIELTQGLVAAAAANGVKFQFETEAADFTCVAQNNPDLEAPVLCQQVVTTKGTIEVEQLIITAGLGSSKLTQTLQQPLPIRPVLGQAIKLQLAQPLGNPEFQPVISGNDIHLVPLGQNQYWLGATVEFPDEAGQSVPQAQLLEGMLQEAIAFCPALQEAKIIKTWVGRRPRPEGIPAPVIQPLAGYRNVILATAHYRNGVLLAPATALEVVKLVTNSLN